MSQLYEARQDGIYYKGALFLPRNRQTVEALERTAKALNEREADQESKK